MNQSIGKVSLLVRDYDEAIEFFCTKLKFQIVSDTNLGEGQRFLSVSPPCNTLNKIGADLVLSKANEQQMQYIGKQAGNGVLLFLSSDDFWRDYRNMQAAGVRFLEEPREEIYATVVVFEDLYGNKWDLLQAKF
jgi:lactoylglutathione lyase